MNLKIKLIDKTLPVPKYETSGSVAFDLYARVDMEIQPFTPTIIPANIIVKIPDGYFLMLASRSSLPLKKNLTIANGIGVIDQDYSGEKDEIGVQVLNFSQEIVHVSKGERIAQAILVQIGIVDNFEQVEKMDEISRGGFGSTNK